MNSDCFFLWQRCSRSANDRGITEKEMAIDWNLVVFNMLTIKGIYGREMYETWYKMTVMHLRAGGGGVGHGALRSVVRGQ